MRAIAIVAIVLVAAWMIAVLGYLAQIVFYLHNIDLNLADVITLLRHTQP